jgi:hypothetical protein
LGFGDKPEESAVSIECPMPAWLDYPQSVSVRCEDELSVGLAGSFVDVCDSRGELPVRLNGLDGDRTIGEKPFHDSAN